MNKIYLLSRIALALIFFFHGLVPKLLFRSKQEIEMNETFMPFAEESFALISSGILEIVFAICLLVFYRVRIFNFLIIAFGSLATLAILIKLPHLFVDAFNPFSTNLSIVFFAIINLLSWNSQSESATIDA